MANKIICIDVIKGLEEINDNSQDLIILDPPYNIGKNFHSEKFSMEMSEYSLWIINILNIAMKKIKATGVIYMYGFPEIVAHIAVKLPIHKQKWLVWHYKNKVVPSLNSFQRSHETILMIWKNKPKFNRDNVRVAYTDSFLKNSAGKKRSSSPSRFNTKNNFDMSYVAHPNGALPRDVMVFPTLAGGTGVNERIVFNKTKDRFIKNAEIPLFPNDEIIKHPTQKPISLTTYLIKTMEHESEKLNIVIPFSGTGVESWVAKELNHNSIAFDINKDYVYIGNKLLKEWKFKK